MPVPVVFKGPLPSSPQDPAPANTTAEEDRASAGRRLADLTAAPKTTAEEDRKTAGQRLINLVWENTQRDIARWVIGAALMVSVLLAIFGRWLGSADVQLAAIVFLFGVANLVTGFYFGRTNHQRVGGVGGDIAGTR